jgi:phage terminase small subunit
MSTDKPKSGRGGYRPGAGRKPKPPVLLAVAPAPAPKVDSTVESQGVEDPKEFLSSLMNDARADVKLRFEAAKALMPFVHAKIGEVGKKDQKQNDAQKVAGRFTASAPPKLVAAGGRKV